MKEPLQYYYSLVGFDSTEIKSVTTGEKYAAVMLDDGRIGVCATLRNSVDGSGMFSGGFPDFEKIGDRILYLSYLNAKLNYTGIKYGEKDIYELIDFGKYEDIVMVGDFKPLVEKFMQAGKRVNIFDLFSKRELVLPLEKRKEYLGEAQAVILTATSLFNGTFSGILEETNKAAAVFLLGPSAILHKDLKELWRISGIFGTVFDINDSRVLDIIAEGHGTRYFQKYGKKVYL